MKIEIEIEYRSIKDDFRCFFERLKRMKIIPAFKAIFHYDHPIAPDKKGIFISFCGIGTYVYT
jgi:hypothetical protein